MSRPPILAAVAATAALLLLACGAGDTSIAECATVPLTADAATAWARARETVDFAAQLPCGGSGLRITSAFVDSAAGDDVLVPRLNVVVEASGERAFVFSQTRALERFQAIPQGTRPLTVSARAAVITATGFVGASASGAGIAYLRWRTGDVTYELAATLSRSFAESDLTAMVRATLDHFAVQGGPSFSGARTIFGLPGT